MTATGPCYTDAPPSSPMIYPWGDSNRIFPPETKFSDEKEMYKELYTFINYESLYWDALMRDSLECVASLVVFVGFISTVVPEYVENAIRVIERCMADPTKKFIAMNVHMHDFDYYSIDVHASELPDVPFFKGKAEIPTLTVRRHSNMLLIDKKHKIVEYFEPGIINSASIESASLITAALRKVIPSDYAICQPDMLCPVKGPQSYAGDNRCLAWSFLYLHLRLKNPHMVGSQIIREMIKQTKIGPPLTLDWLDYMHNIVEELQQEATMYSDTQKETFKTIKETSATVKEKDLARILQLKKYRPVHKEIENIISLFRKGSLVLLTKDKVMYITYDTNRNWTINNLRIDISKFTLNEQGDVIKILTNEKGKDKCETNAPPSSPMIYPWGDSVRIFPPGTQISKTAYDDLFASFNDHALYWAAIMQDSSKCASALTVFTGFLRAVEQYSLVHVESVVRKCMLWESETMIPVSIRQLSTAFVTVDGMYSVLPDNPFFGRARIPALRIYRSTNLLIIDRVNKVVEYFEPDPLPNAKDRGVRILKALSDLVPANYTFCNPKQLCPKEGPQTISKDTLCYAWSLLYLHLRLKNPHMIGNQIIREMIKETKIGPPLVLDWLDVMHTTIEELEYESSSFSDLKRQKYIDLQKVHKNPTIEDILRSIYYQHYEPAISGIETKIDLLRDGTAILLADSYGAFISKKKVPGALKLDDQTWIVTLPMRIEMVKFVQ